MHEHSILVVDDDALVEQLIGDALKDAGYSVVSTNVGAEALRLLANADQQWAGIVTDVNLGAGSPLGWEIARRAREVAAGLAVIYISGDSSHQWMVQGVPLSVMIDKPFAPSRVVVALADLLNARRAGV